MATMKDLLQARKEAQRAQRECENIMRDIASEANYIVHYSYKDEWKSSNDRSVWFVKFCSNPDEARVFINEHINMFKSYYIAKPCTMDTAAFMNGSNIALAEYEHK